MQKIKSLFFSDSHIASKYSQTDKLYDVLFKYQPENIYILGDFIDTWRINRDFEWNIWCNLILKRIIELANSGTKIYYLRGNHDDIDSGLFDLNFHPNITITDQIIKEINERRILLLHGDIFDDYCNRYPILYIVGDFFYSVSLRISHLLMNTFNINFSVSKFLKQKIKGVQGFINHFEDRASEYCKKFNCQEIMMGHIHTPAINKDLNGVKYHNTGDFVEVCSYIIETEDGLELKFVS
jgi:UDP-2,3-diacylglucosamine pyrophosphatase LpxH